MTRSHTIHYKSLAFIAILLLILFRSNAYAYDFAYKYEGSTLYYNIIDTTSVEVASQEYSPENYSKLRKVTIPNTVEFNDTIYQVIGIGDNAFAGAKHLKQINFESENSILYINQGAFAGCQQLTYFEIPTAVTEISPFSFAWTGLKEIEIHEFITKIGERAFTNCRQLQEIRMGDNIDTIDNFAFAWCDNIQSFTIPVNLKHIGYEILQANSKLDTLYYNAINCTTSGAYYDQKEERTVGPFERNKNLHTVIISSEVETLPPYLLYNCYAADTIIIPSSITKIGEYALHNTSWYDNQKGGILYVNNIAYSLKGYSDTCVINQDITHIAPFCFYDKRISHVVLPNNLIEIGTSAFEKCDRLTSIQIPYYTTTIGDRAFANCNNLTDVIFSSSIDSIGEYAFSNCENLTEIHLNNNVSKLGEATFYRCENLRKAVLSSSMKTISPGMFSRCISLQSVDIPNTLTEIGEYAFAGCTSLDSIYLPNTCKVIGSKAFTHCENLTTIEFGRSSFTIGPLAFYKCQSLEYIEINTAQRVGYRAFGNCTMLQNVNFGPLLKEIAPYAFSNCVSLTHIDIPDSVQTIDRYAFADCSSLKTININNASASIGHHAFSNCRALSNAILGPNIKKIGDYAFSNCNNISEIVLPQSLTTINKGTFNKCYTLQDITFGSNLKKIEADAFKQCSAINITQLPDSIEFIGKNAFADCSSITELQLPKYLTTIEDKAFYNCSGIQEITFGEKLELIGDYAFVGCESINTINFNAIDCHTQLSSNPVFQNTAHSIALNIGNKVERIDNKLFSNINLLSVTIPKSVTTIGNNAFANNTNLAEISITPNRNLQISNSAFANTEWLARQRDSIVYIETVAYKYQGDSLPTELTFRPNTTSIAAGFMKNNQRLQTLHLPESLTIIGNRAFEDCHNLQNIQFPESIEEIHEKAFARCYGLTGINLPRSISKIGNFAFEKCNFDSIFLNDALAEIGHGAFYNCEKLQYADLGDNIVSLGRMAFAYCRNLHSLNEPNKTQIPKSITSIPYATFYECLRLSNRIILPEFLDSINEQAFANCRSIHSIELNKHLNHISPSAFNNTPNFTRFMGESDDYKVVNGLLLSADGETLILCPNGYPQICVVAKKIITIESHAFHNCSRIHHIRGMRNVETINDNAFSGCTQLRSIVIGPETRHIGNNIFESCLNLSKIQIHKKNKWYRSVNDVIYSYDMTTLIYCPRTKKGTFIIPRSVIHIADYAFTDCINLDKVVKHKNIKTIGKDAFTGCKVSEK